MLDGSCSEVARNFCTLAPDAPRKSNVTILDDNKQQGGSKETKCSIASDKPKQKSKLSSLLQEDAQDNKDDAKDNMVLE